MKLSHLLLLSAVITSLFGLGLLFFPSQVLPLYGLGPGRAGVLVARLLGAATLGFAVLNWSTITISDAAALRAITMANLTGAGMVFIVLLTAQGQGLLAGLAWPTITMALIFTLAFAFFYLTTTGRQ